MENDNALANIFEAEYLPDLKREVIIPRKSIRIPVDKFPALGALANSLTSGGMYKINVPEGVKGSLQGFKNRAGISGNIVNKSGEIISRAGFEKIPFNPYQAFLSAAVMSIEAKLDTIIELQENILDFLEKDKETKIKGDLKSLNEITDNLKYNLENDKYTNTNLVIIKDIKRDSAASLLFYENKIKEEIEKNQLLHFDRFVNSKLENLHNNFQYYQLSNYMYSFASFLEVMLYKNYSSDYLSNVRKDLELHNFEYKELYTKCYDYLNKISDSSVEIGVQKFGSNLLNSAGQFASKVNFLKNAKVNEKLLEGKKAIDKSSINRINEVMNSFVQNRDTGAHVFIGNINRIDRLYNNPLQLIIDNETMYIVEED